MSNYRHALATQIAEREMNRRVAELAEEQIDKRLDAIDDYLDPFNRERLKRLILNRLAGDLGKMVETIASEALRRAGQDEG